MTIQTNLMRQASSLTKSPSFSSWKLGLGMVAISSAVMLSTTQSKPAMALEYNPTGTTFTTSNVSGPFGIAVTNSGDVLVTNISSTTVTRYNSSGVFQGTFATATRPTGIAINRTNNNVLVADDFGGTVRQFSSAGAPLGTFGPGLSPSGLAVDSLGNVLITDYRNSNGTQVLRYSSTGTPLGTFSSTNLSGPNGIAVASNGDVLVTNRNGGGTVTRYNSAGTFLSTFATGVGEPWNVVIDSTGDVLVSDRSGNRVLRYSSTGTLLQTLTTATPVGLAIDGNNNLLVANQFVNSVTRFAPATPIPFGFSPIWALASFGLRPVIRRFSKRKQSVAVAE